jgi:hypothetical protein
MSSTNKLVQLYAVLSCLMIKLPALAAEELWPTALTTGDCVAAVIYTPRSKFQERLDDEQCIAKNSLVSEKINACKRNAQERPDVPFFTDRCGNDKLPFFISLNGVVHELHLIEKNNSGPVYFSGKYAGEGLEVKIDAGPLLRKIYEETSPTEKGEVVAEEYRVFVTVTKGSVTQKIPGVFWSGR